MFLILPLSRKRFNIIGLEGDKEDSISTAGDIPKMNRRLPRRYTGEIRKLFFPVQKKTRGPIFLEAGPPNKSRLTIFPGMVSRAATVVAILLGGFGA